MRPPGAENALVVLGAGTVHLRKGLISSSPARWPPFALPVSAIPCASSGSVMAMIPKATLAIQRTSRSKSPALASGIISSCSTR